ncbi:MAG TPA: flippase [Thermoplasmatales archaeon]|nr:flippase [Thermoplasmatales archaeon]
MIARKSALIIFTQIINALLGYTALKFIALYMQPWEYGVIGFAYGFVALFSVIGNLGFNAAHVKRVSEGKNLGKCVGTFAAIKTFLAGFMAGTVFLSIAVWKHVFGRGFESPIHEQAVYVMLSYFVLLTLTQVFISTFNARKETAKAQLPLLVYTLVRASATILVAFHGFGVLALAYTYVAGEILHLTLAMLLFKGYPVAKPSLEYLKSYIKFAMPMSVAAASAIIMTNIDKVFIQLFWSATQVGEYFATFNLSRFIIIFSGAVGALLLPTVSSYHSNNNLREIKKLTLKAERYLSMITFPIIALLITLSYPVIHILLSDKYLPAVSVLKILPLFVLLEVLSGPYTQQLSGMNMPRFTRNRILIMMITNVSLNLILIPQDIKSIGLKLAGLGAEGAAIATVVSYLIGLIYIRTVSWRITGLKGISSVATHAFSATLTGFIVYYITLHFLVSRWFHLLAISLFGLAIYVTILYLLKEFKKEDMELFLDTLNIKKMLMYIREELKGTKR